MSRTTEAECPDCSGFHRCDYHEGVRHGRQAERGTDLRTALYQLDWPEIMVRAVTMRPTSFGLQNGADDSEIRLHATKLFPEFRSATDEIAGSVIHFLEEEGIIESSEERRKRVLDELRDNTNGSER